MRQLLFFAIIPIFIFAASMSAFSEEPIIKETYNPRRDFPVGVGTVLGTPLGVMGIQAECHVHPRLSAVIGVGSGVFFNSFHLQARYFFLERTLSPYLGLGYARWTDNGSPEKLARYFSQARTFGLVDSAGNKLRNAVDLIPLAVGLHFLSDKGLALFGEFNYIFSTQRLTAAPYGGLGGQWYF
ncbi:MAG: hypothetical protein HY391_01880 [Deltaproteobacteria bacterium]|nr:hypothetical protein [Deltaproteobacteria bacterium]